MAFGRTEYSFGVEGADTAERAFLRVAAAEDAAGISATKAAREIDVLGRSLGEKNKAVLAAAEATARYQRLLAQSADTLSGGVASATLASARADAEAAVARARLTAETKASNESVAKYQSTLVGATEKTGVFSRALGVGSTALAGLGRAAAILPGFGIAGLLLAIGEGAKYLYESMSGVSEETKRASMELEHQKALAEQHTEVMNRQAEAARGLATAMTQAGEAFISAQTGIGGAAGGQGYLNSARIGGDVGEIREAKDELRRRAGELQAARVKLMQDYDAATDLEGTMAGAAAKGMLIGRRDALAREANEIRRLGDAVRDREVDLMREVRGRGGDSRDSARGGAGGRTASGMDPLGPLGNRALPDIRAQNTTDLLNRAGPWAGGPGASNMQGPRGASLVPGIPDKSAMDSMAESFNGAMDSMVMRATDASSIMVGAIGAITGALGQMATNAIIAGDAGGKGAMKMAGNALAGLSAQAFGYAVLLEGMALVALLAPMIGLPAAGGLAAAGGVMAGIGATLAISARAMGADKLGAKGSRGGASAGGGASASGTNPYAGQGGQAAPTVIVYLGEDVVTRGVRSETRREAQRGGMSGHFAMAG